MSLRSLSSFLRSELETTSGTIPYKEDVGFGTTETRVRSTACLTLGELLHLPHL